MKITRLWLLAVTLSILSGVYQNTSHASKYDKTDPYSDFTPESDKDEFNYDDSGDVPWKEQQDEIPAPPTDEQLTEVDIDHPPVGFKVYVSRDSVSVGEKDAVIRYWLVLKAGKSRNAMYEGVRCDTIEYKTYAYENRWKKGKVNKVNAPQWIAISGEDQNRYRIELFKYYFCAGKLPRAVADIRQSLIGSYSERNAYDELINQ
ncbi:MAG: CNP1-like family protein [Chromatiales bacterium]|jgi:hypothetical protein